MNERANTAGKGNTSLFGVLPEMLIRIIHYTKLAERDALLASVFSVINSFYLLFFIDNKKLSNSNTLVVLAAPLSSISLYFYIVSRRVLNSFQAIISQNDHEYLEKIRHESDKSVQLMSGMSMASLAPVLISGLFGNSLAGLVTVIYGLSYLLFNSKLKAQLKQVESLAEKWSKDAWLVNKVGFKANEKGDFITITGKPSNKLQIHSLPQAVFMGVLASYLRERFDEAVVISSATKIYLRLAASDVQKKSDCIDQKEFTTCLDEARGEIRKLNQLAKIMRVNESICFTSKGLALILSKTYKMSALIRSLINDGILLNYQDEKGRRLLVLCDSDIDVDNLFQSPPSSDNEAKAEAKQDAHQENKAAVGNEENKLETVTCNNVTVTQPQPKKAKVKTRPTFASIFSGKTSPDSTPAQQELSFGAWGTYSGEKDEYQLGDIQPVQGLRNVYVVVDADLTFDERSKIQGYVASGISKMQHNQGLMVYGNGRRATVNGQPLFAKFKPPRCDERLVSKNAYTVTLANGEKAVLYVLNAVCKHTGNHWAAKPIHLQPEELADSPSRSPHRSPRH